MNQIPLPRWARISIALACVGIGLASSTVNGWLLVRGLELTEPDASARTILIAAGILMITVELVAFFLTALLPAAKLHRLSIMGLALWMFGVVTIFGTRLVLNHSAEAAIAGQAMRIDNLRAAISTRMSDVERVRANGERQNASNNAWTRHLGTLAIRQAEALERDIEPLRDELADLQAQQRTTLPKVLGPGLALAHSVAMPVLVSTIGLTMFGVAGMMLRRQPVSVPATPAATPATPTQFGTQAAPRGVVPVIPGWRHAIPVAAVAAAGASAFTPVQVHAAPTSDGATASEQAHQATEHTSGVADVARAHQIEHTEHTQGVADDGQVHPEQAQQADSGVAALDPSDSPAAPAVEAIPAVPEFEIVASEGQHPDTPATEQSQPDEHSMEEVEPVHEHTVEHANPEDEHAPEHTQDPGEHTSVTAGSEQKDASTLSQVADRFERVRAAILAGSLKPSVRAIQAAESAGTATARRYLVRLAEEGVIEDRGKGKGYILAAKPPGRTDDLFA